MRSAGRYQPVCRGERENAGQPPARVVAFGVGGISLSEGDGIAVVFPSAEMRTLRPFLRDGGCVDCHQCADAVYGRTPDGDKPL